MRTDHANHRVAIAVPPGAPVFEVSVPCEVFGIDRPDLVDPWYTTVICPTAPSTELAGGFVATQGGTMADLVEADTVVVPGCRTVHHAPPSELLHAVREAHRRGARVAGICSGAFVLGHAGLLDRRRATTHWMHAGELAARFPTVRVDPSVLYVEDAGIYTSAGTAAGIDLCLELVRCDHGTAVVNELARRMVVPPHRDGGQAQYVPRPATPSETFSLAATLQWARAHLARPTTVDDLAQHAHVSHRTLVRRFHDALGVAPQAWLLRERLRLAQELLETTALPLDRVAERCGLGTATNLRRHFGAHVGVSPLTYRRTFRP